MLKRPCTACETPLPRTTEYFYRCKHGADGLDSRCKKCKNGDTAKYHRLWKAKQTGRKKKDPRDQPRLHPAAMRFIYGQI